jgi:Pyruvate/2-oxoacid:ferredoxin oxidoreductase delta subunit
LNEDIINEAGVCQNCFIKFNEYDEHLAAAEHIQFELINFMENRKFVATEEESEVFEQEQDKKPEEDVTTDAIEYEPFESEGMYLSSQEEELEGEVVDQIGTIEEDIHYEIIVDDTMNNVKKRVSGINQSKVKEARSKSKNDEFLIIETDSNQKIYQCDICLKFCKDKSKLRSHREIHTDKRNVICPVRSNFKTKIRNSKNLFAS